MSGECCKCGEHALECTCRSLRSCQRNDSENNLKGFAMTDAEIKKLHKLIENHCQAKGFTVPQILRFLSLCFVGTVEMHGYSEEFFDATLERMKKQFKEKRRCSSCS